MTVSGQSVGDTATYECRSGFDPIGPLTRTCTQTSPGSVDWSGEAPICRRMCSLRGYDMFYVFYRDFHTMTPAIMKGTKVHNPRAILSLLKFVSSA